MGVPPALQAGLGPLRSDCARLCRAHPPGLLIIVEDIFNFKLVDHNIIPQRLLKLDLAWDIETTRTRVSTLVTLAYSHPSLAALPPSLLAASAILTALRPALETGGAMLGAPRDTPSPSSSSSCSSTSPMAKTSHSPLASSSTSAEPLAPLLKAMERITGAQRSEVQSALSIW